MSRRLRVSQTPAEHPTYRKILDCAVEVLIEDGFDRFNVQKVLDGAQVSRPTLYRHFSDVDTLIEVALVEALSHEVDRFNRIMQDLITDSPDLAAFRAGLRGFLDTFSMIPAAVRFRRAHAIVLGSTRPDLAAGIADIQEALNDSWYQTLRAAQERGFVRGDIDTRAVAVIIQSVGIGRIIDDAAVTHVRNEQWAEAFFEILDHAL